MSVCVYIYCYLVPKSCLALCHPWTVDRYVVLAVQGLP